MWWTDKKNSGIQRQQLTQTQDSRRAPNYRLLARLQGMQDPFTIELAQSEHLGVDVPNILARKTMKKKLGQKQWIMLAELTFQWVCPRLFAFRLEDDQANTIWKGCVTESSLHHHKKVTKIKVKQEISMIFKVEPIGQQQQRVYLSIDGRFYLVSQISTHINFVYQMGSFRKRFATDLTKNEFNFSVDEDFALPEQDQHSAQIIRLQGAGNKILGVIQIMLKQNRLRNDKIGVLVSREVHRLISIPFVLQKAQKCMDIFIAVDLGLSNGQIGTAPSLHDRIYREVLQSLFDITFSIKVQHSLQGFGLHEIDISSSKKVSTLGELIDTYNSLKLIRMSSHTRICPLFKQLLKISVQAFVIVLTDGDILDIHLAPQLKSHKGRVLFIGLGEGRFSMVQSICHNNGWEFLALGRLDSNLSKLKLHFLNFYFRAVLNKARQLHFAQN